MHTWVWAPAVGYKGRRDSVWRESEEIYIKQNQTTFEIHRQGQEMESAYGAEFY